MREDMAKVVVERPRILDSARRRGRAVPLEALPTKVGLRRHAQEQGGYKMLNENLAPLRRYIEAQLGRPWSKVYSEISQRLKPTSTVQQHVRDHLADFVQLHPSDDVRYAWSRRGWHQPFYVDARDGILKRTDRLAWARALKRAGPKQQVQERIVLNGDRELRRINGLWFEVRMAPLPAAQYVNAVRPDPVVAGSRRPPRERVVRQLATPASFDVVTGTAVLAGPEQDEPRAWAAYRRAVPHRTYAVAKRQLSRSELRRFGLANCAD